jgi:hypothetical protein
MFMGGIGIILPYGINVGYLKTSHLHPEIKPAKVSAPLTISSSRTRRQHHRHHQRLPPLPQDIVLHLNPQKTPSMSFSNHRNSVPERAVATLTETTTLISRMTV